MLDTIDPRPFWAVWAATPGRTEATHQRFRDDLFRAGEDSGRVAELILAGVARSQAAEADKTAVVQAVAADWRAARVLAAMASSMSCGADWLQEKVIARAESLGLTAYAIAQKTGGRVSEDHVQDYLKRRKSMGSHKLQSVLAVLGLDVQPLPELRNTPAPQ